MITGGPFRIGHSTLLVSAVTVFLLMETVSAQGPMFPGPVPQPSLNPLPKCPEMPMAFSNGIWFYVTSDCRGVSGFGQSLSFFPDRQCNPDFTCRNPVSTVGPQNDPMSKGPLSNEMERKVLAISRRLNRIAGGPSGERTRRAASLQPLTAQTLTYVRSSASNADKQAAFDQLTAALQQHEKHWNFVGLAPPNDSKLWVTDNQVPEPPKTAAETVMDTSSTDPSLIRVNVSRGSLLRVNSGDQTTPEVFFQTFTVKVNRVVNGAAVPPEKTLLYGIECAPTAAEKTTAIPAQISERGAYAHRLRDPSGRPVLVNGYTNLE